MTLDKLVPQYFETKQLANTYSAQEKEENAKIKELMLASKDLDQTFSGIRAKVSIEKREGFNEDKLLQIAHKEGLNSIIKTKEYIDFDAMEDAIYKGEISKDVLLKMDNAKEVKEVIKLRVSKVKEKK